MHETQDTHEMQAEHDPGRRVGRKPACTRGEGARRDRAANGRRRAPGLATAALAITLALLAQGCSWVDVDERAEAVGVVRTVEEVDHCRKVGEIGSKTLSRVGFVARNDTKVAVELERLARNDAVAMGANTLVPLGPVTAEGTRRYGAYRCAN